MSSRYAILKNLPIDIWYRVKDFLNPADVVNILITAPRLWDAIFAKDDWLKLAKSYERSIPLIIGRNLGSFRPDRSDNHLYLILIAAEYSGELMYKTKELFSSLRSGYKQISQYELEFPSGIILNIREIITGSETATVPFQRIFNNKTIRLEYLFYGDNSIGTTRREDITGIGGTTTQWEKVRHGFAVKLREKDKLQQIILTPDDDRAKTICAERLDKETGFVSSFVLKR